MTLRSVFVCRECGQRTTKWLGRCPACESWDSLVEEAVDTAARSRARGRPAAAAVFSLADGEAPAGARLASGMPLVDRVLGGGIVPGGVVLLAGEPGIGKSTLALQLADALARSGRTVLYASAEESVQQVRLRAERLGCSADRLMLTSEATVEPIAAAAEEGSYAALVADSVQAFRSLDLDSAPGSISQVREVAQRLVALAKRRDLAVVLIGHVTKEGAIAGPKTLEHVVDTVLAFEGEPGGEHRILRVTKNRFGPSGEVALFAMHDSGLVAVTDPSRVLLSRRRRDAAGSAVAATLQGTRPLLVEVQALVHHGGLPSPRRMSVGVDGNRTVLLVAILERFAGIGLADRDVFVNVVGGLSVREPAVDLAVAAALLSAASGRPLPGDAVFFGEIGLLGELRPVAGTERRLREAAALGFRRAFLPAADVPTVPATIAPTTLADLPALSAVLGSRENR